MFTGIVTHQGVLATVREMAGGRELVVASDLPLAELALGASLAHDGICLTVVAMEGRSHTVQASHETLARTTLGAWREGRAVNLERSLRLGDELGGHLVFGHVDAVGEILAIEPDGDCHRLEVAVPPELAPMLAVKGSIAVDGISLTVNEAAWRPVRGDDHPAHLAAYDAGPAARRRPGQSRGRHAGALRCPAACVRPAGLSGSHDRLSGACTRCFDAHQGERCMAGAGAGIEVPHLPGARVLVVEARFYAHINDLLLVGARAVLETAAAKVTHVVVPGALEIPPLWPSRKRVAGSMPMWPWAA